MPKYFGHTRRRKEMCDNSIKALKKRSTTLGKPTEIWLVVQGSLERSWRKIMDGLRLFLAVDSYATIKSRDLQKETRFEKVVKPRFTTDFLGAVIREDADELTWRAHEEGVLRTFYRHHPRWKTNDGSHR